MHATDSDLRDGDWDGIPDAHTVCSHVNKIRNVRV